jgi:hypothetical protein
MNGILAAAQSLWIHDHLAYKSVELKVPGFTIVSYAMGIELGGVALRRLAIWISILVEQLQPEVLQGLGTRLGGNKNQVVTGIRLEGKVRG